MKKSAILLLFMLSMASYCRSQDVIYLTQEQFILRVMDYKHYNPEEGFKFVGDKPCVIDFYTTWCGPCKRLAPIMEELSQTYCEQVRFYKVDTERERELAAFFRISSIPQVLYIPLYGEPILLKGLYPQDKIVEIIETYLLAVSTK
ncbi:MAG: thioredoxin domain-containing protein [Paludibacteraceae bacterium]|nr:thioredoxin domain-containing protein [Paludibacteraceae bacterium]